MGISMSVGQPDLGSFIAATRGEDWTPGWSDCASWVLRWVAEARPDALSFLPRPRSSTPTLLEAAGGLEGLCRRVAARLGLDEVEAPEIGDVAVVIRGQVSAAAIRGSLGWWIKDRHGVARLGAHPIVVWRYPTCRKP